MTPLKDSKATDLNYWKKFAHIFIDSFVMFRTNQVPIRAGGLSFSSLLAFVPFAIIFSWIAGLTGHVKLLAEVVPELNKNWGVNIPLENLQKIISHTQSIDLDHIGIIGILGLFLTFLIAISNLEKALNIIWGIHKHRNWLKRVQIYTPFFLLLGFFILVNAWILVKFKVYMNNLFYSAVKSNLQDTLSFSGILLSVVAITWLFISFTYIFIPYTRINFRSAITGSTIITIGLFGFYYMMISFQSFIFERYSIIYGSLASFPLLMLVLYTTWLIILYGATLSRAHQKAHL